MTPPPDRPDRPYYVPDAVRDLRAAGLDAEQRAYGFRLTHRDAAGEYVGECGSEHDWSISLSLVVGRPPVRWFFRYSVREMTEFLVTSYRAFRAGRFATLADALADADGRYDLALLRRRLEREHPDLTGGSGGGE